MSRHLFDRREITCVSCGRHIGYFTPDMLSKPIACKCGTRFQIQSAMSDWQSSKGNKTGLSFTMGVSAVVDNPLDRNTLKSYSNSAVVGKVPDSSVSGISVLEN